MGVPIASCEAPGYAAFDPTIRLTYGSLTSQKPAWPKAAFRRRKPVQVHQIQTTRGSSRRIEMIQASRECVLSRKVGIEATIEVFIRDRAHFELRARHALAPAVYNFGATRSGDPSTSTGFAMFGPSPHCAWKGKDLVERIGPLWGEKDEASGSPAGSRRQIHRGRGEVIPLFQYVQPIIHKKGLKIVAQANGMILPQLITQA